MEGCKDESRPYAAIWNLTDAFQAKSILYSPAENVIIGIVYPILFVLGLAFNGAFLYVVLRVERMHTVTNMYLSHLAVADVIYVGITAAGVVACFASSPVRFDNYWVNTSVGCFFIVVPLFTTYVGAICIVTLVTFERYQAIVNPLGHRSLSSKSRTRKLLAVCWVFSTLVGTGATLIYSEYTCLKVTTY